MNEDIPNLDAMSIDELLTYMEGNSAIDDWKTPGTFELCEYAACKARAIQFRLDGDIPKAITWEKICDLLYQMLPTELRW